MSSQEKPEAAFILSLIGGVLMLVGGGMAFMWFMYGGFGGMMGGFGGMMGGYHWMMGSFGVPFGFMGGLSFIGLVSGIIVIIGAVMLNTRPEEHKAWGTIILLFSIISFLGMGGFYIGAVLGIVGGALALGWRPRPD
ncbi:MAG: hypothetical protein H3Z50_02100 [archaeon]|nr:hypothetical protein [archaeon]MCP8306943.1 hypothetical protein [archaeon]